MCAAAKRCLYAAGANLHAANIQRISVCSNGAAGELPGRHNSRKMTALVCKQGLQATQQAQHIQAQLILRRQLMLL